MKISMNPLVHLTLVLFFTLHAHADFDDTNYGGKNYFDFLYQESCQKALCTDQSVSYEQPASTGWKGWNGYCGETSLANIRAMLCGHFEEPIYATRFGSDLAPGEGPNTLAKMLTLSFKELKQSSCNNRQWIRMDYFWAASFLKALKESLFLGPINTTRIRPNQQSVRVTPTPVLLNSGHLNYHWVTIVDLVSDPDDPYGCQVTLNSGGLQYTAPCSEMIATGNHSGMGYTLIRLY